MGKTNKPFRAENDATNVIRLLNEWENETLGTGEHPDELCTRLTTKRTLLQRLGEIITETNLARRFVDAIKR